MEVEIEFNSNIGYDKKVMTKTYEAHKRKLCVINFQLHVLGGKHGDQMEEDKLHEKEVTYLRFKKVEFYWSGFVSW